MLLASYEQPANLNSLKFFKLFEYIIAFKDGSLSYGLLVISKTLKLLKFDALHIIIMQLSVIY